MSDNWLQLVPSEPEFQPSVESAEEAKLLLESVLPDADEVSYEFTQHVTFFDPMGNWSGVKCPICEKDVEAWWQEAMDKAANNNFSDLAVITPCCGNKVSLNEMNYVWPAAFGSFALEAMNPNVTKISPDAMEHLTNIIGCRLRAVWQHL